MVGRRVERYERTEPVPMSKSERNRKKGYVPKTLKQRTAAKAKARNAVPRQRLNAISPGRRGRVRFVTGRGR
jgi:hypothetical protein